MSEALLVPIHVDALLLDAERLVVEALADFSRLPYVDPVLRQDVNGDNANIGEAVASQAFHSQNLPLKAGVHLHWAMPDALTRGIHDASGTRFDALPDRWLVTRRGSDGSVRSWMIESDHLLALPDRAAKAYRPYGWLPAAQADAGDCPDRQVDAVAYLYRQIDAGSPEPFRWLGRQYTLEDWLRRDGDPQADRLPSDQPLTALGCGDISFAAFYPNCRGVFGFHDDDVEVARRPAGWRYDVVGWHAIEGHDPLCRELLGELLYSTQRRNASATLNAAQAQAQAQAARLTLLTALAGCVDAGRLAELLNAIAAGDAQRVELAQWLARQPRSTIATAFARLADTDLRDRLQAIDRLDGFRWSLDRSLGNGLPHRTLYVASVSFPPSAAAPAALSAQAAARAAAPPARGPPQAAEGPVTIAIGDTTMEALSAYLAHRLAPQFHIDVDDEADGKRVEQLEDQLESLHLFGKTAHRQLDVGAKFREARHDSGFTPVAGGVCWAIELQSAPPVRPTGASAAHDDSPASHAQAQRRIELPPALHTLLASLNVRQQALDLSIVDIAERRRQLFSDWYKYMLAAYHPPDAVRGDDYPDVDEVRYFIEQRALAPLEQALAEVGDLRQARDELCRQVEDAIAAHDGSLLVHIRPCEAGIERSLGQPEGVDREAFDDRLQLGVGFTDDPDAEDHANPAFSQSLDFDGNSDGARVQWQRPPLSSAQRVTVSAWIKANRGLDDSVPVFAIGNRVTLALDLLPSEGADRRLEVTLHTAGSWQRIGLITPGRWHHLVLSCKDEAQSTRLAVCIDGQPGPSITTSRTGEDSYGALYIAGTPARERFTGRMTQIRVDNRVLSVAEIRRDMNGGARPVHRLHSRAAPRYWQPNEPVVLLVGGSIRATERHGQDGRLRDDGALNCVVADGLASPMQILQRATAADDRDAVATNAAAFAEQSIELIGKAGSREIACKAWRGQPWHPIMLEWEALLQPARGKASIEGEAYAVDTITANYDLPDSAVDLRVKPHRQELAPALTYSNRCFLTPHAGRLLLDRIGDALKAFFEQLDVLLRDFAEAQHDDKLPTNPALLAYRHATADWAAQGRPKPTVDSRGAWRLGRDFVVTMKDWYHRKPTYRGEHWQAFAALPLAKQADDPIYVALCAAEALYDDDGEPLDFLSQSLGGFNDELLMHKRTLHLPVADPLGFEDGRRFTERVAALLGDSTHSAPEPHNPFSPIRTGALQLTRLRLIDSFGQVKDFNREALLGEGCELITPQRLSVKRSPHLAWLPPRLVQPARIGFRWLPADENDGADDPQATPICGWVLPNNLQKSLAVYDHRGHALGSLLQRGQAIGWVSAPGCDTEIDEIANPHLRQLVAHIDAKPDGVNFLDDFLTAIESALETTAPESHAQHRSLALLVGRPLAVVRIELALELQGHAAVHQGWHAFQADLRRDTREHDGYTEVEFPVRIGEYHQLNDGVVGYWLEQAIDSGTGPYPYRKDADSAGGGATFHAPQTPHSAANRSIDHPDIRIHRSNKPVQILQSIDGPALHATLLFDPRGKLHLTCGVLPTKVVDIPAEDFAEALEAIEVSFLTAPLLCAHGTRSVPVPDEPGFSWAWIEHRRWIDKAELAERLGDEADDRDRGRLWTHLAECGWIQPSRTDANRGRIVPIGRRLSESLRRFRDSARESAALEDRIESFFWSRFDSSASVIERETFERQLRALSRVADATLLRGLWNSLLAPAVHWLDAVAGDPSRARVVPIDDRMVKALDGPAGWQAALASRAESTGADSSPTSAELTATWVQRIFASEALELSAVDTQASFEVDNEIREGWLLLQRQRAASHE